MNGNLLVEDNALKPVGDSEHKFSLPTRQSLIETDFEGNILSVLDLVYASTTEARCQCA